MKVAICYGVALIGAIGLGCTGAPTEPTGRQETRVESAEVASAPAADQPGYYHTASISLFAVGTDAHVALIDGKQKTSGSLGVFVVDMVDGSARAVANAEGTTMIALTDKPDVHNQRVRNYFLGGGLPADQIDTVQAMATMKGSGTVGDSVDSVLAHREFHAYTSAISRVVAGIPVPDSFAWARFQADGTVEAEGVHWPTVPGSVVAAALALQTTLTDPVLGSALMRRLPGAQPQVVIRHSPAGYPSGQQVFASIDVRDRTGLRARTRHFDAAGSELTLNTNVGSP